MPGTGEECISRMVETLNNLLAGRVPELIEVPAGCADDDLGRLVRCVNRFVSEYGVIQPFLTALSRGDLDYEAPRGRFPLLDCAKNLQANLRHLTWKTQQVAKGDLSQQVDFMGEFSENFNLMVRKLASNREELLRKNQELETASQTDSLTGLRNRRGIGELLRREMHRAARSKRTFAIMLADIDRFKQVNDTYGHDAGDAVLVEVARILHSQTRGGDLCVRWGGEEFLTILVETDLPQAVAVAERARLGVASAGFTYNDTLIHVTISAGVSIYNGEEAVEGCIKRSDVCLYRAKEAGRNQVWFQKSSETLPMTIDQHPLKSVQERKAP